MASIGQNGPFIPIDHKGESASTHIACLPNEGQLTSLQGTLVPEVAFYSVQCMPQYFLTKQNQIFFQLGARDTSLTSPDMIYRIGLEFVGNPNPDCSPIGLEELPEAYNFIQGHCPNGIYDVHPVRRVLYENIYTNVDLHVYSNPWGPKLYLVLRPGANPTDIKMRFEGQDSLLLDLIGNLHAIIQNNTIILPKGLCYQQIGGTTQLISTGLDYQLAGGIGTVTFDFEPYDPAYPLIIDISASLGPNAGPGGDLPEWCTFYGHTESDYANDAVTLADGSLVVCGTTYSPNFPLFEAQFDFFDGGRDAYYSEFDAEYHRTYTTFFGGNGVEDGESIQVSPDGNSIYLNGRSTSTNLPVLQLGSGFFDNTSDASGNCYVARFSRVSDPPGEREWVSYFGNGIWTCNCMRVDDQGDVHLLGTTDPFTPPVSSLTCQGTSGSFPACDPPGSTDYFKGTTSGGSDAFYASFDENTNLVHSTFFGGSETEHGRDMVVDNGSECVYIVGNTASRRLAYTDCQPPTSGSFPLCNRPGSYFQDDLNGFNTPGLNDGYIAAIKFDGSLAWSTYVGSTADETGHVVGMKNAREVYMAGLTSATTYATASCTPPTGPGFPNCAQPDQLRLAAGSGLDSQYIIKFNDANELDWTTFVNGYVTSFAPTEGNGVFLAVSTKGGSGGTAAFPVQSFPNRYFQAEHANGSALGTDAVVMELTEEEEIAYCSYVGGNNSDGGIVVPWVGGRIYVLGGSASTADFPFHCPSTVDPYCYLSYVTQSPTSGEAFYAQLQYDATIGMDEGHGTAETDLILYPNPASTEITVAFGHAWEQQGQADILIHDALGRNVRTYRIAPRSGQHTLLPLGELPKGIYVMRIGNRGTLEATRSFLVQ